jgi:hypothetical protein
MQCDRTTIMVATYAAAHTIAVVLTIFLCFRSRLYRVSGILSFPQPLQDLRQSPVEKEHAGLEQPDHGDVDAPRRKQALASKDNVFLFFLGELESDFVIHACYGTIFSCSRIN